MIDEVTFGAADRIRPSRPKYAFIVGANQGVFPKSEQNSGLFANSEREKMISLGIKFLIKLFRQLLMKNACFTAMCVVHLAAFL